MDDGHNNNHGDASDVFNEPHGHAEALDHDAIVEEAINDAGLIPPLPPTPRTPGQLPQQDHTADHTIQFAHSLKLRQPPSTTITSFDAATLTSKCSRTSPQYDPTIDPSILGSALFCKDEIWISKEVLFDALSTFASLMGCKAVKSRDVIKLKSRNPNLSVSDDTFYLKLRALHNEKKSPATPKDPNKSIPKARPVWEREVQIREVSTILPDASLKRPAEEELHNPSTGFAYTLKKVDGLSNIIIGFDDKTFVERCSRYISTSDGEDVLNPHYQEMDMDAMAMELFKQNDVWISRDVLYHALSAFASIFGFKVVKTRNMLVCKRYGSDNGNRNWSAGPWKVGCPFGLALKALHTERKMTENPKDPEKATVPKCRPVWEREVLIKEANCLHGGGCRPGEERALVVKKAPKALHPNVTVMKSPNLVNLFTKIRDENTLPAEFVQYSKRIMRLLAEDTAAALPAQSITVNTPTLVRYKGQLSIIDTNPEKVCLVSIIRAGDALLESFREIFPGATVGKMWIQRNEASSAKEAIHSCTKLPHGINEMEAVVLCDPMLATGGSSMTALYTLINQYMVKPERILFANVISCPEGLDALAKNFPEVKIVTAWVDEGLNGEKFILPGLGDYGDRFFNTVPPPAAAAAASMEDMV